jgi:hypothetical protein
MVLLLFRKHASAIPTSVSSPTLSGTGTIFCWTYQSVLLIRIRSLMWSDPHHFAGWIGINSNYMYFKIVIDRLGAQKKGKIPGFFAVV